MERGLLEKELISEGAFWIREGDLIERGLNEKKAILKGCLTPSKPGLNFI